MDQRYARNFSTISLDEQAQLGSAGVCVTGLGGLGGCVAEMLARTGVGNLVLVDGDRFESSNLNRQLLCTENLVGTPKADAAENRVKAVNGSVKVRKVSLFLKEENAGNILSGCDLVVDCLDSIEDRFLLQEAAQALEIPLVSGAIAGTFGQATVIFPEDRGFELIYGKKRETRGQGAEKTLGNIASTVFFMASIQVSEVVKVLLNRDGVLKNRLLIADLESCSFEIVDLPGREGEAGRAG
ncbi:MAG: HesA/MoeB/ThiF family protein [Desulfobacteraceae bacterium]